VMDIIIIGAGPAGVFAARRAADLGAKTTLITRDEFGGMGATDGPVPVRTLAHAARLIREARQLGQYGIAVNEPMLEYPRLLARVHEVVTDVRTLSLRREDMDRLGVTVYEKAGTARASFTPDQMAKPAATKGCMINRKFIGPVIRPMRLFHSRMKMSPIPCSV
jgi:pyruvate/2-oxoglutarate dehydrogenase complex dihydrolipoamide dehydrogenase (E3) component